MTNFMRILQDLIDDENITLKSLSRKIKVPSQVLYAYKNKDSYPNLFTSVKIAEYFDCSLNYLFGLDNYWERQKFNKLNIKLFYERYLDLLQRNNISHYCLYKKIGLNNSSITKWKKDSVPNMDSLIKIAKYFDVSIDYLVGRSDEC